MQGSVLGIDQSEALFVRLPRVIFDDPGRANQHNEALHTTPVSEITLVEGTPQGRQKSPGVAVQTTPLIGQYVGSPLA